LPGQDTVRAFIGLPARRVGGDDDINLKALLRKADTVGTQQEFARQITISRSLGG
jgi:hypothetical protein